RFLRGLLPLPFLGRLRVQLGQRGSGVRRPRPLKHRRRPARDRGGNRLRAGEHLVRRPGLCLLLDLDLRLAGLLGLLRGGALLLGVLLELRLVRGDAGGEQEQEEEASHKNTLRRTDTAISPPQISATPRPRLDPPFASPRNPYQASAPQRPTTSRTRHQAMKRTLRKIVTAPPRPSPAKAAKPDLRAR